ncbi:hypothetical protein A3843_04670 [Pseudovibrio exalbescens]|uniref:Tyrosine specific protein phosphatases domain-containing protein n=2 Tax=Pseudovibrio exalbescens TaxID=197461 RepID=A0A1U7JJX3_9HYPH|nr:hypothetical protein A3843_04670 [Pseudovibrio exalbescens]
MAQTYPIATIPLNNGGRIGMAPLPGRFTCIFNDVEEITDWFPQIVVSLTLPSEAVKPEGPDLGELLSERGISWYGFPLKDFDIPKPHSKSVWDELSTVLHDCLNHGGSVMLHCRGGCGRSGMVALRLLRERGLTRKRALQDVRAAQPFAVETEHQLGWGNFGFEYGPTPSSAGAWYDDANPIMTSDNAAILYR